MTNLKSKAMEKKLKILMLFTFISIQGLAQNYVQNIYPPTQMTLSSRRICSKLNQIIVAGFRTQRWRVSL